MYTKRLPAFSIFQENVGSITSHCSRKEPAHERAAEIEPKENIENYRLITKLTANGKARLKLKYINI